MKIQRIYFNHVGPLGECVLDFTDNWTGDIHSRILLSGPNGCGKSTVLRAVAMLWDAAGYWLDHWKPLKNGATRQWLEKWGGLAIEITESRENREVIFGLVFGPIEWCEKLQAERDHVTWLGEGVTLAKDNKLKEKTMFMPLIEMAEWSGSRKKMILGFTPTEAANIVLMDAEERRWVEPTSNVGDLLAESPALRWAPKYHASSDWEGQLEASLINLKLTQQERFLTILAKLNQFLIGKQIDSDIELGGNRLRVRVTKDAGKTVFHTLDELSSGEHQILIMLYQIARWAEKGAVVMIDEPDLHLHPSLISSLLSQIEKMVAELGGQLIITSHAPDVWHRYESNGRRIELGNTK
jgi:energy-coupling factor transporter ATP-binding protein EcfA2